MYVQKANNETLGYSILVTLDGDGTVHKCVVLSYMVCSFRFYGIGYISVLYHDKGKIA